MSHGLVGQLLASDLFSLCKGLTVLVPLLSIHYCYIINDAAVPCYNLLRGDKVPNGSNVGLRRDQLKVILEVNYHLFSIYTFGNMSCILCWQAHCCKSSDVSLHYFIYRGIFSRLVNNSGSCCCHLSTGSEKIVFPTLKRLFSISTIVTYLVI